MTRLLPDVAEDPHIFIKDIFIIHRNFYALFNRRRADYKCRDRIFMHIAMTAASSSAAYSATSPSSSDNRTSIADFGIHAFRLPYPDIQAAIACERHFEKCGYETPVATVVARQEQSFSEQPLNRVEGPLEQPGVFDIRRHISGLHETLGEGRSSHPVCALPEIYIKQSAPSRKFDIGGHNLIYVRTWGIS